MTLLSDLNLTMFSLFKRPPSIAVGVLLLSCIAGRAHAEIDVITGINGPLFGGGQGELESTYVFNESMILNSVGFFTYNSPLTSLSYTLNSQLVTLTTDQLQLEESNGLRWFNLLTPLTVDKNSILTVRTQNTAAPYTFDSMHGSIDSSSNVTFAGTTFNGNFPTVDSTNSNLRVTALGGSVAPEPGSFALALTGGAALIGICIRRRRNAA
jgi:hypothetical protein